MKLGIISNMRGVSWAGSETVWHQAAMLALREGHEVTALVHPDLLPAAQMADFRRAGGRVHPWRKFPIARFQGLKEKIHPNFPPALLGQFDALLVALGSLPALNYVPGLVTGLAATETPFVLFCQFNAGHLVIAPRERRAVIRVMEKSAANVFVSRRNLLEARRQFAMEPPGARVILNSARDVLAEPEPWPDGPPTFSFASVARFEMAWKGQDLLLEILSQPPWRDRPWRLRFYGGGPDLEHLQRLTAFFKLEDRVIFEGFVADLSAIWSKNHILLLPSHGEGTPLAALEAMMYGRPVVATDVGGNTEIIEDGATGYIAEAATVRSFAKALERAWQARDQWPAMGLAAHQSVRERAAHDPAKSLLAAWIAAAAAKV